MKASALIACITILAAFAFLGACQPGNVAETDSCMECHSGDTTEGNAVLAAQDQYDNSGHANGPRVLDPFEATTGHTWVFHGGNAMYCNGTTCSKCHTQQGFVDFIAAGMPTSFSQSYGAASQPGCFTCHKPHISGDFSMRKESSENLITPTTTNASFNGGKGNLCVTCHKSLTGSESFLTGFTGTPLAKGWSSSSGPHHGPQADFLLGENAYEYNADYQTTASPHLAAALPDSCVSCHMYGPTTSLRGSLQLGGHGMYLTGDVHGTVVDVIGVCRSCHTYSGTAVVGDFESNAAINLRIDNTRANRDLLIVYFGTAANFAATGGASPIQAIGGGNVNPANLEWGKDWEFVGTQTAPISITEAQSYAFWNFKFFMEDRSDGIHNPLFAHRILWDAVNALGLTPVPGTRP